MKISRLKMVRAVIGMYLVVACGSVVAQESITDKKAQQDKGAAIARGAQAWSDNCARCHNMRQPNEFRDDLWKPIVTHMRVRGGLTGQESRDILLFLQTGN